MRGDPLSRISCARKVATVASARINNHDGANSSRRTLNFGDRGCA